METVTIAKTTKNIEAINLNKFWKSNKLCKPAAVAIHSNKSAIDKTARLIIIPWSIGRYKMLGMHGVGRKFFSRAVIFVEHSVSIG
jgi:hypothetical protein